MAFTIKDTEVKVTEREIFHDENEYTSFPTTALVNFEQDELIPIGLLSYQLFDSSSCDAILIAVPNLQGIPDGDYGPITYSFIGEKSRWKLDNEFIEDPKLDEEYLENYESARDFYLKNNYIMEYRSKSPLFTLGGQPPLGQNWDSILYNEMGDNPELDYYHDVTSNINDPKFEYMSTREIVYLDERDEKEYVFLGSFRDIPYLDMAGSIMVFYQHELKKVMLVVEYD